ncbi:hypothetical protein HanRHA438_Chr09g0404291 [Helianthus annuus]|nr:hypothetical protein HanIR_Chr09g0423391 [Helianthus annuus]KAJ0888649.1 hypothetical protein HanRHA438_Chr09g0404291 [Helianthus annuus]KAJ0893516.1 hypothetical protein HanPSC8_Chr09g0378501 [Helianthus annuus]
MSSIVASWMVNLELSMVFMLCNRRIVRIIGGIIWLFALIMKFFFARRTLTYSKFDHISLPKLYDTHIQNQ